MKRKVCDFSHFVSTGRRKLFPAAQADPKPADIGSIPPDRERVRPHRTKSTGRA